MNNIFPYIPLSISVLFAFKIILIYTLAVAYGHVNPIFPYLSDAGATHPEAAYFSILLYLESILIGIMGWIRFKQIIYICNNNQNFNNNDNKSLDEKLIQRLLKFNRYGLYCSAIIMLGMAFVAAFRSTEHLEIHLILGAILAFGSSFIYFLIQTWFAYQLIPTVNSLSTARFRLMCSLLAFIFGLIMIIAIAFSFFPSGMTYAQMRTAIRLLRNKSDGGYVGHCVSAVFENLTIFIMCPFYASFVREFMKIESKEGKLKFNFSANNETTRI